MKRYKFFALPAALATLWLQGMVVAAEPSAVPVVKTAPLVALTPQNAGPDFAIQGEYRGNFMDAEGKLQNLGVQVAALGEGNFKAVFLAGGLPGEGWDQTTVIEIDGKTQGQETLFKTDGQLLGAVIANGVLSGQSAKAEKFTLQKVGRTSPTLGLKPPQEAQVLFDGTSTEAWERGVMDARKLLAVNIPTTEQDPQNFFGEVAKSSVGAGPITKQKYGDFSLHLEFMTPFKPTSRGQGRGNSGVYIQQRYEVQVLDSFGFKLLDTRHSGDICGEIYKQQRPQLNMCFPPLSWQTYDIDFKQPQWSADGRKLQNALITVRHNGVVIHHNYSISAKTGAGKAEAAEPGPILLQGHGEPIMYRNIWIVPK